MQTCFHHEVALTQVQEGKCKSGIPRETLKRKWRRREGLSLVFHKWVAVELFAADRVSERNTPDRERNDEDDNDCPRKIC